jgi:hypothetical protein
LLLAGDIVVWEMDGILSIAVDPVLLCPSVVDVLLGYNPRTPVDLKKGWKSLELGSDPRYRSSVNFEIGGILRLVVPFAPS